MGGVIKIWKLKNLNTFELVQSLSGHDQAVSCLAMINDWIVSGSEDKTIKLWKNSGSD